MDLSELIFGHGLLWLFVMVAAVLALLKYYVAHALIETLSVFLSGVVAFLFVGGWLLPAYIHTWDPAVSNLQPHWAFPILILLYAAHNIPVGTSPSSGSK